MIRLSMEGGTVRIRLSRPERLNALSRSWGLRSMGCAESQKSCSPGSALA